MRSTDFDKSGSFQVFAMTKKNPDKREQSRLKKIEDKKQGLRYRAAQQIVDGNSLRVAGKAVGMSADFVRTWRDRLLEPHVHEYVNGYISCDCFTFGRLVHRCTLMTSTSNMISVIVGAVI